MTRAALPPRSSLERRRIRLASIRFTVIFAVFWFGLELAGRKAYFRSIPWLEMSQPGPVSLNWALTRLPIAVLIAALGGFFFSRMIRFPQTKNPDDR